jgi:hypothetical protein
LAMSVMGSTIAFHSVGHGEPPKWVWGVCIKIHWMLCNILELFLLTYDIVCKQHQNQICWFRFSLLGDWIIEIQCSVIGLLVSGEVLPSFQVVSIDEMLTIAQHSVRPLVILLPSMLKLVCTLYTVRWIWNACSRSYVVRTAMCTT